MSLESHKLQVLPRQNTVVPVDTNTVFLAHYDLNERDVLNGIKPIGNRYAMSFDGVDDYLQAYEDRIIAPTTIDQALAVWVYPTNISAGCIVNTLSNIVGVSTSSKWQLSLESGKVTATFGTGRGSVKFTSTGSISANTWTHICITKALTTFCLYINGVLDSTSESSVGTGYIGGAIIGRNLTSTNYYTGKISSLILYTRTLSASEVVDVMNDNPPIDATTLGYWPLSEVNGNMTPDIVGSHDAVINGPVLGEGRAVYSITPFGYYGGGIAVEEGTTNLMYGKTLAISSSLAQGQDAIGKYVTRLASDAATYVGLYPNSIPVPQGATYTYSLEFMSDIPFSWSVDNNDYSDTYTGNDLSRESAKSIGTAYTTPGRWQRVSTVVKLKDDAVNPKAASLFYMNPSSPAIGHKVYYRNPQLELKGFPTTYIENSRSVSNLMYRINLDLNNFTLNFWAKTNGQSGDYAWYVNLYPNNAVSSTNRVFFRPTSLGGLTLAGGRVVNGTINITGSPAITDTTNWHMYTLTSSGTTMKLYYDGALVDTATVPILASTSTAILELSGTIAYSVVYDELRIDKIARTDDEILSWYYSNSPFWPKGIYKVGY